MKAASSRRLPYSTAWILPSSLVVALFGAGCASTPEKGPVTVEQIIQMSRNGTDAPIILAKMQEAGTVYRLSGSRLAMLKSEGVPDPVLDYMLQTYLRAERQRQVDNCVMGPPYFVLE
jgi:hypothetical protein